MTTFTPSVWADQGARVEQAADDFYRSAYPVITAQRLTAHGSSPIDAALVAGDGLCHDPWHKLIANRFEAATDVASRMVGTGTDYAATEAANTEAAQRFW